MNAFIFVSVLILIACVLMVLVVLVQNSKGGGLASNFSSSNQYMGVRKTADFLEKFTWGLAVAILVLCLFSIVVIPRGTGKQGSADTELRQNIDENAQPVKDFQAAPKDGNAAQQQAAPQQAAPQQQTAPAKPATTTPPTKK